MEEQTAQERAIEQAIAAMSDPKEKWLSAAQATAWATIAMAITGNNRQAYVEHLAKAAALFVEDKTPEHYAELEAAVFLYREAT